MLYVKLVLTTTIYTFTITKCLYFQLCLFSVSNKNEDEKTPMNFYKN